MSSSVCDWMSLWVTANHSGLNWEKKSQARIPGVIQPICAVRILEKESR